MGIKSAVLRKTVIGLRQLIFIEPIIIVQVLLMLGERLKKNFFRYSLRGFDLVFECTSLKRLLVNYSLGGDIYLDLIRLVFFKKNIDQCLKKLMNHHGEIVALAKVPF